MLKLNVNVILKNYASDWTNLTSDKLEIVAENGENWTFIFLSQ